MRLFSFETTLTVDEIQARGMAYLEDEQHSPWNIFSEYTSSRTGLHLYVTPDGFTGYYENGERNRTHSLQLAKTWAKIKIKEKNGKRKIEEYAYFCPILMIVLLIGLINIAFAKEALALAVFFRYMRTPACFCDQGRNQDDRMYKETVFTMNLANCRKHRETPPRCFLRLFP